VSVEFDTYLTDHLLSTTRSVRRRLDLERGVEPEVILDCIRLAQQAPTGSNVQGWRFIVITDPQKRIQLADLYRKGAAGYHPARFALDDNPVSAQTERVWSSARHLIDVLDRVPVLVIPCLRGRLTDVRAASSFYGSIIPAVWSFMLALRSRGLGSVYTTFHLKYESDAAALLGIPQDVTQVALIPVAYTLGTDFNPAVRPPVEAIVSWNQWSA
jgi:nitroreductase